MKTAESQWIPIGAAVSRLATAIGRDHAIGTLLMALQRSELVSVAPIFNAHGRARWAIRGGDRVEFPSTATNHALPPEFWLRGFHRPDNLAHWADWERGNFSFQDGLNTTGGPYGRSATGVLVDAAQAVQVLKPYVPDISVAGLRGANVSTVVKPVGRPPGKGMYADDPALFAEGVNLFRSGEAASIEDVIRTLIPRVGGASVEAKRKRIRRGIEKLMDKN